ncbi:glycoside hydrolase family 2 TIM barrel-domain containing protein [Mucilaginibacter agri]|nr:glycoside hydrolase family 2 TIM barrel-domain containing protein [Mucilaginibacter agri]
MMYIKNKLATLVVGVAMLSGINVMAQQKTGNTQGKVWSAQKANDWYKQHKWLSGANYIPANAINQLEMWQADTFDPATIDKELGWAQGIGFNTLRVFLHSLAYKQDPAGFKKRINQFLTIADKHHIQPLFVFLDDCWNPVAQVGKQPEPKTGVHNSGWLQDPGDPAYKDPAKIAELEIYVKDILRTFGHDKRILMWDLFNEAGNSNKKETSLPLLTKVFQWARVANPDQPVSSGVWDWSFERINQFIISNSDVITYHDYSPVDDHRKVVQILKSFGKPLICTEYMARTHNSRFETVMPMLKKENVGAINWGFVAGKTNTMYSWEKPMPDGSEPEEWFHDIFRKDGTPYRQKEVDLIRQLNGISK